MKLLFLSLSSVALTCSAFSSVPIASSYVIQGSKTDCFLLMRPTVVNVEFSGMFSGIASCFRIKEDGGFEQLWQIEGGYSFSSDVFLGGNGRSFIRIVDAFPPKSGTSNEGIAKWIALEVYKDGKLIKNFKTEDIVDPSKLEPHSFPALPNYRIFEYDGKTAPKIGYNNHFDYLSESDRSEIEKLTDSTTEIFCIKTVQAEILVFKVSDGSLIYRKKLK